jgi:hypothetical protein
LDIGIEKRLRHESDDLMYVVTPGQRGVRAAPLGAGYLPH